MKHIAPQFDLPLTDFALVGETARNEPPSGLCIACKETAPLDRHGHCEPCQIQFRAIRNAEAATPDLF